jgi:hypothetical protein
MTELGLFTHNRQFSEVSAQNSRYKDGKTKACAFGFLPVSYGALQG